MKGLNENKPFRLKSDLEKGHKIFFN
jgi:hypothetical protein